MVLTGTVDRQATGSYLLLPFEVTSGTTRVEVGYRWADRAPVPSTPMTQTVLDLGLWDEDGTAGVAAFRGWGGSRQGKLHAGQPPVWVQADSADRGFTLGAVEPGTWHVELGVGAVAPSGATWQVEVRCLDPLVGSTPPPDRVDPAHVARPDAGWYHGDFHMHGFHSNPNAPTWPRFVEYARAAQLDFLPVTEYVVGRHWDELGATQRDNPDLVVWPGREIITYKGHASSIGESPSTLEYRHGHNGINLRDIQTATRSDGALFQVNHPTFFPGPLFASFCRGCEFELDDEIDWDAVDTIEVLTGPAVVSPADIGAPSSQPRGQNPFAVTAIDLWEDLLRRGHKITAVSGSDDKLGPNLGNSATAVYARELSRPALIEALRAGRAYVRARGVAASPSLEMSATAPDGSTAMFGGTLAAATAEVTVTVRGGAGQQLLVSADGQHVTTVIVQGDVFTHTFTARALPGSGPLGTFWRVDTADPQSLTTIGNPVFLRPSG